MKALVYFSLIFFAGLLDVNAQSYGFESKQISSITSNNAVEDDSYQFNVLSITKVQFSCTFNARVEDELSSEATYKWFKEVSFFDVKFTYTFKAFELNMTLENLLGFNNNNFAIEPNLEEGIGNIQNVLFTHEADFLVCARFAYNF